MKYNYPDDLPISVKKDDILRALQEHQILVVAGETGSGKTTQLPKICHQAFPHKEGLIGCTQPRRIAASSVATRVAEEVGSVELVGYKIRFNDFTRPKTKIKFMTDGILLAEIRTDPLLLAYHSIIVDEAHERSLNIDFLLGYLKTLLPKRPELRLIISSATIDTAAFAKHFQDAPVILVSGRTYPVETWYLPVLDDDESLVEHCNRGIEHLFRTQHPADTLVFLPTERDIRECCEFLVGSRPEATIMPLYGRMAAVDQQRIFKPSNKVKIIVATNVAETSITVPGIRYVVDSGLARISHYNVNAKTTSLPVEKVSQASCNQRTGRCGRVGPGICVRLFGEDDFLQRELFTKPEIQRSNLADVILRMISYQLGDPANFPYLDKPQPRAIREGYKLLEELGAIDQRKRLLPPGRFMASLPIDPCISRIILEAKKNNCLLECKIISAALAIQDPRIRPADLEKEADSSHQQFAHPFSDFMALLNIWQRCFGHEEPSFSWSQLKKLCKNNYLSFQRMREWYDLHEQLDRLLKTHDGFLDNEKEASYQQIHKSLLSGLARNLGTKKQGKMYLGANQKEVMIFPGSHQFLKSGPWIVAASFLETNRLYALTVATIEPEWIEEVVGHLCRYQWTNPTWHKKSGQVMALETASVFGLVIVANRKVNFGKRHPKNRLEARRIFFQDALVSGNINGTYDFLVHNLSLLESWRETQAKLREKNILADEVTLGEFYNQNLPAEVYDQRTLNRYLHRSRKHDQLFMQENDVVLRRPEERKLYDFPASIRHGTLEIPVSYHFEPGSEKDGITFHLSLISAQTVSPHRFSWLVPGLLPEKISFLLKSLPKSLRKRLVPMNETVGLLLDDIGSPTATHLLSALEQSILKNFKFLVQRSDWTSELPDHLTPRFMLCDDHGKEICAGRDLSQLLRSLSTAAIVNEAGKPEPRDQALIAKWDNTTHTEWDFDGLPETVVLYSPHGATVGLLRASLVAETDRVRVTFGDDAHAAARANVKGNLLLLSLQFHTQLKGFRKQLKTTLSGPSVQWLIGAFGGSGALIDAVHFYLLHSVFGPMPTGIIAKQAFDRKVAVVEKGNLYQTLQQRLQELLKVLRLRREVEALILKFFGSTATAGASSTAKRQELLVRLQQIIRAEDLLQSRSLQLGALQRYLKSLAIRAERCYVNQSKDDIKRQSVLPFQNKLEELEKLLGKSLAEDAVVQLYRYKTLYEEYHVSVFSPELGTVETVSPKILQSQWQKTMALI